MNQTFQDKDFPIKKKYIYLNHCGVSPLYSGALKAQADFNQAHTENGIALFQDYPTTLPDFHAAAAELLRVPDQDISFMKNTAEGLSLIAAGYPFKEGDEIISYIHEYPSNHYPWKLQEQRGVKLVLLTDANPVNINRDKHPKIPFGSWSMADLEAAITPRTRMIALSHVQFTSGFAADLPALGALCKKHDIDLIIDAAQSIGSIPIFPSEWNIAAVAASGWKWLMGPLGTGILYTSQNLRDKLAYTAAGADMVKQGDDYLNHNWQPYTDGRRFEYSTASITCAVALTACLQELFNPIGIEAIQKRLLEHRSALLAGLNADFFSSINWGPTHQSAINSFILPNNIDPVHFCKQATEAGVFCSSRGGYARLAPHVYTSDVEIQKAILILNDLATG